MKKLILITILVGLMAVPAFAMPTVTVSRTPNTYPAAPVSGEFTLTPNAELMNITAETGPFQSFCVEALEGITIGNTYDVVVNVEAILGDGTWPVGSTDYPLGEPLGPGGYDLLDPRTAYLYTQFRAGTLGGAIPYDYVPGAGRMASALALQTTIWHLEYESGYQNPGILNAQGTAFLALANASGWSDIGNVRVLNLYDPTSKLLKQDMLVMVPAPGAVLLGGIGVCLVGWLRRRRTL